MKDMNRLAAMHRITSYELSRPGFPSEWIRDHETRLLMELVRLAHENGQRFDGWPVITLQREQPNDYYRNELLMRAEVNTVAAS